MLSSWWRDWDYLFIYLFRRRQSVNKPTVKCKILPQQEALKLRYRQWQRTPSARYLQIHITYQTISSYRPQQQLRKSDVFTPVCLSFHSMDMGGRGEGYAWHKRGMCGKRGVHGRGYVCWGSMHGMGHVWQGGHAQQGTCVVGGGCVCAWQERWPLQQTVRYASYSNAFLFFLWDL